MAHLYVGTHTTAPLWNCILNFLRQLHCKAYGPFLQWVSWYSFRPYGPVKHKAFWCNSVVSPVVFAVVSSPQLHSTWPGFLQPASSWLDLWPYCSFVRRHIILAMNTVQHNWSQYSTICLNCSWFALCVCVCTGLVPQNFLESIQRGIKAVLAAYSDLFLVHFLSLSFKCYYKCSCCECTQQKQYSNIPDFRSVQDV